MITQLLLSSTISCLISLNSPVDYHFQQIICEHRKVSHQINHVVAWQPYVEEYFKPEDRVQALRIIFCESSGRPNVIGNNTNGTQDVGGWQFNDKTWAWLKGKLKFKGDRTEMLLSTRIASWLVYNDGWHHWNSSRHCWETDDRFYKWFK